MPHMTPDNTFVLICEWRGRLTWSSASQFQGQIGDFTWQLFADKDVGRAKEAFARTSTLGEKQMIELQDHNDQHLRIWFWPLDPPESAVCILGISIPSELAQLTSREKDCLELLAQGLSTKLIAAELDIGLSTVHTHIKRLRKKLKLPRVEALIGFAARLCHPGVGPEAMP